MTSCSETDPIQHWAEAVRELLRDAWSLDEKFEQTQDPTYKNRAYQSRSLVRLYLTSIRNRLNDLDRS